MKKTIGVLVVVFALALVFAFLIPDQRKLLPPEEAVEVEKVVADLEIPAFNHVEYALLKEGRYLAVLDPGGFEGERHGGALTIFDTLNAAVVERIDNVAGFTPLSLDSGTFLFSARTGLEFSVFSYEIETGLSSDLNLKGGQGGIVLLENGEVYMSSNARSKYYGSEIEEDRLNFFGASDWAMIKTGEGAVIDAIDGLDFSLDEVYPKIYPIFGDDGVILSSNNISLVKEGEKFLLRVEK